MANKMVKSRLRDLVLEYYEKQQSEAELASEKARLRKEIEQILDELKRDTMDFELDNGHNIRVSRFVSTRINYDTKLLLPVLKAKGLIKRVCEIVVNPKKLEAAYNTGLVDFADVEKAAIVNQSKVFKVQKVKAREADV